MATVKAKNAAGEWVDAMAVGSVEIKQSEFKMVWIPRSADGLSYDLSPYLLENDDFLMAFVYGTGMYDVPYMWLGSEGKVREIDGDTVLLDNSNMVNHSPLDMFSDAESSSTTISKKFSYDKVSRTFTFTTPDIGEKLGMYAALIYAG